MLDIAFFKNSEFFKNKKLKKDNFVFKEWEIDNNFYIILSWKISIEKYTTKEKKDVKELDILYSWDFFWESSLSSSEKKELSVKALEDTELIYINSSDWFEKLLEKNPKKWFELLKHIIEITNKRLLKENKQITANYEIVKSIVEIKNINEKNIFLIIEKIKLITGFDYILYFESNPVIDNFIVLKYDSREAWKLQDKILDIKKLEKLKDVKELKLVNNNFIQKLSIWELNLWYMIFWKKDEFNYEDKKLVVSVSNSLTWLLKQKEFLKEELNKNYMKNI